MRTNIEIDDRLMSRARQLTKLRTKRDVVQRALEDLVQAEERRQMLRYYGSGVWEGNLKRLRRNRV